MRVFHHVIVILFLIHGSMKHRKLNHYLRRLIQLNQKNNLHRILSISMMINGQMTMMLDGNRLIQNRRKKKAFQCFFLSLSPSRRNSFIELIFTISCSSSQDFTRYFNCYFMLYMQINISIQREKNNALSLSLACIGVWHDSYLLRIFFSFSHVDFDMHFFFIHSIRK